VLKKGAGKAVRPRKRFRAALHQRQAALRQRIVVNGTGPSDHGPGGIETGDVTVADFQQERSQRRTAPETDFEHAVLRDNREELDRSSIHPPVGAIHEPGDDAAQEPKRVGQLPSEEASQHGQPPK
jgi:hypothetical protein